MTRRVFPRPVTQPDWIVISVGVLFACVLVLASFCGVLMSQLGGA